jgi:ribosome-binding factor A
MSHRMQRVRVLLRQVGSEVLRRLKDPGLEGVLVSITDVTVTADLAHARFFVSVLAEPEGRGAVLAALNRAAGHFRHELAQKVRLKKIPEVTFTLDESMERAARLFSTLERVLPREPQGEGQE